MRKILLALVALATLLTPLHALATDAHAVGVFSNGYRDEANGTPVTVIPAGTTVTWVWESGAHTVTGGLHAAAGTTFDSGVLVPTPEGTTYSVTFDEAGTYVYFCRLHAAMRGVVQVE